MCSLQISLCSSCGEHVGAADFVEPVAARADDGCHETLAEVLPFAGEYHFEEVVCLYPIALAFLSIFLYLAIRKLVCLLSVA